MTEAGKRKASLLSSQVKGGGLCARYRKEDVPVTKMENS